VKRSLGKCDFAVEDAWKNAMGKKELLKEVEEAAASKIPDPETMPTSEKKRKKEQGTTSKEDANIQFAAMSEEEQLASLSAALESDSGDKLLRLRKSVLATRPARKGRRKRKRHKRRLKKRLKSQRRQKKKKVRRVRPPVRKLKPSRRVRKQHRRVLLVWRLLLRKASLASEFLTSHFPKPFWAAFALAAGD